MGPAQQAAGVPQQESRQQQPQVAAKETAAAIVSHVIDTQQGRDTIGVEQAPGPMAVPVAGTKQPVPRVPDSAGGGPPGELGC